MMQKAIVVGVFVAGVFTAAWFSPRPESSFAQRATLPSAGTQTRFLALSADTGEGRQQVTVIDTESRALSVYHIEYASGAITLKSVRNIEADLLMDEFNTESPLPREIRAMLTKQR